VGGVLEDHYIGEEEGEGVPEWTTVARVGDVAEGEMLAAELDGLEVLIANVSGEYQAIGSECTHEGCSLAEGEIDDDTVICPCHGSIFDLKSGAVIAGPATEGEPAYNVRVEDGEIKLTKSAG
jgi:nitrite reductase/ring-hydroxylating ferredoxin subunit